MSRYLYGDTTALRTKELTCATQMARASSLSLRQIFKSQLLIYAENRGTGSHGNYTGEWPQTFSLPCCCGLRNFLDLFEISKDSEIYSKNLMIGDEIKTSE